jgi:hypothetical protein
MGSTLAIVVAVAAVVAGFFIMRSIRDGDTGGSAGGRTDLSTTVAGSSTTLTGQTTSPSTTAKPQLTYEGTLVQVANSARQDGVAKKMTDELKAAGFKTVDPVNGDDKLDTTVVLLKPGADETSKAVAQSVAYSLGLPRVTTATEEEPPTSLGDWPEGCNVIVLLGKDVAGKPLSQLGPNAIDGATPTQPSGTTPPTTG